MADAPTFAAAASSQELAAAFSTLRGGLRSYLRRRVGDSALIDDLVQDVFVKASAAIAAHRAPRNLTGWLYAAARTAVADHYRSARPDSMALSDELPEVAPDDDEFFHQQLATCLRPLTRQLPAIYRDTLIAIDLDGKTMLTLANELGVSLSAIKSRASRGRRMLKEKLLECCEVEISDGTVSDFRHRTPSACGKGCA